MLRCLVFGCPGTPIFELSERISEFHKLSFHTIEIEPCEEVSYFDDKIPTSTIDTGDFSSGSAQERMVRDPSSLRKDKELDKPFKIEEVSSSDCLAKEELAIIFQIKQGIICTEIPDKELIRWANKVVYVYTDEKYSMNWYKDRRKCPSCGNVHHLKEKPPKHSNICDRCGTDLIVLEDDTPDKIKAQFKNWRNEFWKFKETSSNKGILKTFSIEKFKGFDDLCRSVDRFVNKEISYDKNWYNEIAEEVGLNPNDGPYIWDPLSSSLIKKEEEE